MHAAARWIGACTLSAILTLPLAASQPTTPAHPVRTAPAVTKVYPEPHPEINAAIRALERAKNHLQKAAHDFGGHRVEAIQAIDAALNQLRQALQYDKE
jgi:hypothetical protein